jgi:hypothetical protein
MSPSVQRRARRIVQLAVGLALVVAGGNGCFLQADSREIGVADAAPSTDTSLGAGGSVGDDVSQRADARPDTSITSDAGAIVTAIEAGDRATREAGTEDAVAHPDAIASDGPTDAAVVPEASFGDFADPRDWESVASGIGSGLPGGGGFSGGAFDGRYVYFAPTFNGGTLARYDTRSPFTLATSWSHLDLKTIDTGSSADAEAATSFAGALFDGRYLYLAPFENQPGHVGLALQCDTTAPGGCVSPTSWATFSLSGVVGSPCGYSGAVYDGRYVTFIPFVETQSGGPFTVLARFDTQAAGGFRSAASWSTLQMVLAVPAARGAIGGVFDGRHIYFISPPSIPSIIATFDTTRRLDDFGAWLGFDVASDAGVGQYGGAFDGRFVYLTPAPAAPTLPIVVARCDTLSDAGCASAAAWARFDVGSLIDAAIGQYAGAAFDGRYLIFAPYSSTTVALRFDTTRSFADAGSWSRFDVSTLQPGMALGFVGAVFDGEYVYLVPMNSTFVMRFHARRPAAPPGPPAWGSFY